MVLRVGITTSNQRSILVAQIDTEPRKVRELQGKSGGAVGAGLLAHPSRGIRFSV